MTNFFGTLLQSVLTLKNHLNDDKVARLLGIVLIVLCDLVGVSFYGGPYGENVKAVTEKLMKNESASPKSSSAEKSNQRDAADDEDKPIKDRLRNSKQEQVSDLLIVRGELP